MGPAWLLVLYRTAARAILGLNYKLGIKIDAQESAEKTTEAGMALWYGFALGDLLVYITPLILGFLDDLVYKMGVGYW